MTTCLAIATAQAAAAGPHLQILSTPGNTRFGMIGTKGTKPLPTLFFLGAGVEESLTEPQYVEAEEQLGSGVLFVTIDLPGHGVQKRAEEPASLPAWRFRLDHGQDLVSNVNRRGTEVLDYLVKEGYTDPEHVAVFGTSRGGFMAFHFAAAEARIRNIAGFAPVTDLLALSEFAGMTNEQPARALAVDRLVGRLVDRGIWMIIGSTDHRVATARTIELAQRLVEEAEAQGIRPAVQLHVEPTVGHRVPDGCYAQAARWLQSRWAKR